MLDGWFDGSMLGVEDGEIDGEELGLDDGVILGWMAI